MEERQANDNTTKSSKTTRSNRLRMVGDDKKFRVREKSGRHGLVARAIGRGSRGTALGTAFQRR